jgi:chromate reductase
MLIASLGRALMRLLGISGSLRRDSHNRSLLRAAARLMPPGVGLDLEDLVGQLPLFNEDLENDPPASVIAIRDAVDRADGLLIATPEYNSSIPGVLKNAIDWLSRPIQTSVLRNKPTVVIGASTGMFGAVWSQAEARKTFAAAGARVIDIELPVPTAHEQFDEDGSLVDGELREQLLDAITALVDAVNARPAAAKG